MVNVSAIHLPCAFRLRCAADDPTIPYLANGYIGRTLVLEMDNLPEQGKYWRKISQNIVKNLYAVDYIVSIQTWSPYPESSLLFNLKTHFKLLKSFDNYHVWERRSS